MKIKGMDLTKPYEIVVVIPRDPSPAVFKVRAVRDLDAFDKIVPPVKAPMIRRPGKAAETNEADPEYRKAFNRRGLQYQAWINLMCLSATEGLEWDTVKLDDPSTYINYVDELSANFTPFEVNRILEACNQVMGLSEKHLAEARERFLSGDTSQPTN